MAARKVKDFKAMEEERRDELERIALERERRNELERIAAEREFLERFEKERKLSRSGTVGSSVASSVGDSESEAEIKKKRTRNSPTEEDKRKAKKDRKEDTEEDDDDGDDDELGTDPLENLGKMLRKLRAWSKHPSNVKMIKKGQALQMEKHLKVIQEEIIQAREERAALKARVQEREAVAELVKEAVREELKGGSLEPRSQAITGLSYVEATKKESSRVPRVSGMKGPVSQAPKQVIVRHASKESEEVTKILKKLVKPSEIGLKVRRLVNIRNGVIVEAEGEEGADNLARQDALKKAGLKVERPEKKKPLIMIYDVSTSLTDDEIKEEVFVRNMEDSLIAEDEFRQEFEVKHKYNDKRSAGKKCHIVVESSIRVRNWLRGKERVFVEWQSCRVKDYVDVARCYRCQRFGHVAKHCKCEKPSCSHCAGDHDFKDCTDKNKEEKACCSNCKRDKRENCKHDAGWRKCPAYERAVKRLNGKIDYGL